MLCLSCARLNAPEARRCAQCGADLPVRHLPPRLEGSLLQLEKAARDIALGQITTNEFSSILDGRREVCEAQLDHVTTLELAPDLQQEMAEEMALGTAGIQGYLRGLETMRRYLEDRQFGHLEAGLAEIRDSNELLNRALALNWTSFYAFQESTEEFLAQFGNL